MNITLYKYYGERNRIDKSTELSRVLSVTGQFKADTSIFNPVFLLSLPLEGASYLTDDNGDLIADVIVSGGEDSPLDFNYFYVQEFKRFYFVTNIVISSGNLVILTGEVDPLYSFKDEILLNQGMIERNEFTLNAFQEDSLLPLRMSKSVTEYVPTKGIFVNTNLDFGSDVPTDRRFTIAIASIGGYKRQVNNNPAGLPSINTNIAGDCGGQAIFALNYNNVIGLVGTLMGEFSAYSTFFKSLTAYPYVIDEIADTDTSISVLKYDDNTKTFIFEPIGISARYASSISDYRIIADFQLPYAQSFLDYSPYTHYEIYIPLYGWYELDFNSGLAGHRILVFYSVNYENGSGEVYVYDYTGGRILFSSPCQIGIALSLSSSNAQELEAQKNAMQSNLILSLIGAGIGVAGGLGSGQYVGAIGAGLSGVQAITSFINQKSLMFTKVQSTHNGSTGGLYAYPDVHLRITKAVKITNLDLADFAHQFGRPLREVKKLGDLSGFTIVSKIHLDGLTATDAEKSSIETSLLQGVII